jgi:hypothetical protein
VIDYTRRAGTSEPDGDLGALLHTAWAHAERLLGQPVRSADAVESLTEWSDTVRAVGTACRQASARGEEPAGPVTEALEKWLAHATACLSPYRRLLQLARTVTAPPLSGDEMREVYIDLLVWMHFAREEADRCRRTLAAQRGGIPPEQATERFVTGRTAHQDLVRRILKVLPEGDGRRDHWSGTYAFLTVRVAEYGGDSPGEVEGSLAIVEDLLRPGSLLDDDERALLRAVSANLATLLHTGGDPARSASYAQGSPALPAVGEDAAERAQRLRDLEVRRAAQPQAVHESAVQLRMELARGYRSGKGPAPAAGVLPTLLGRLTRPGGGSPGTAAGERSAAELVRARELGAEALGLLARRALVQEVAADAVLTAERAGVLSREIAAWCVEDSAYEEAVEVLERGRSLALHTEMATVDVCERLAELGRADLADEWHAWRRSPLGPDAGPRPPAEGGAPGGPWDSYVEHPVPDQLGVRVRAVLEEHGALDDLLGPVSVPAVSAALRGIGADELVFLLPTQASPVSGGALRVGSDGRVRWTAMPGLADPSHVNAYLGTLETLLASPGSDEAEHAWRTGLRELCDWAGTAVMKPLTLDLASTARGPKPRAAAGDGVPHLVLVPLGPLAAVPWGAARMAGRSVNGTRATVDGLVLSMAPSARMFIAAAARPAVRAADSALLVLGLTGEEARASSSRVLHLLYRQRRLLTPDGHREGRTRPREILDEIQQACGEHGIVDISAHLMPDPSDSWRSHLAFGATGGERAGGADPAVDRLSVQTVAAQRFVVPAAGPGLCVSPASCINSLPRRHHDESFTMAAAFLTAGASFVLGSLWPVRLHATALLDLLLHHRLREGDTPANALRRAQLWMTDPERKVGTSFPPATHKLATELLSTLRAGGHDPADPALWAGLVVVGR